MQSLYNRFIKPLTTESEEIERETVLNFLLLGILGLSIAALADMLLEFIFLRHGYFAVRILTVGVMIGILSCLYALSRYNGQHKLVALILVTAIASISCQMVYLWGLLVPTGILLGGLAIVMAGILISARSSLYVAAAITFVFAIFQYAQTRSLWHPDLAWMESRSTPGDVIGFAAIFSSIALVSWLFNRQMEMSLRRAQRSEKALQRQKELLEIKVQKRAQQIEAAQLEKMQELYRFAELGRLSTALFHDLANHLSSVHTDIEGLKRKEQSDIMHRIHQNVGHIDNIVQRVREQIRGKSRLEVFNVMDEIDSVIDILSFDARQAGVEIVIEPGQVKRSLLYRGDPIRFRQIILNLVCNSIEAYQEQGRSAGSARRVLIELERKRSTLFIKVSDNGPGIPPNQQSKVFEAFYTTKDEGVGIGLFVVRQVVENDFHGSLAMESTRKNGTTFIIGLPKSYYADRKN